MEVSKLSHATTTAAAAKNHASAPLKAASKYEANPSGVAISLTVTMAWQLAIVVLAPIFAGHVLDGHLKSMPLWTIVGLVIAMIAMIMVVRRTLAQLNEYTRKPDKDAKS